MKVEPGEINIICSDLQTSLHFYCNVLGFIPTTDEEGFYHLRCGRNQYLLLPIAQRAEKVVPYGSVPQFSMDLTVEEIQTAYEYLKEQRVIFAEEWHEGDIMFVIRDPDGLPWEIIKREI